MSTSAFGDFSRERADRARRLLEESEEHRGSSDLQKYYESIEFSDQMHAIFQDGERPREGLTAQQKQQGLVVFCRFLLANLGMPACSFSVESPTFNVMVTAAEELIKQYLQGGKPVEPLGLLGLLADTALYCVGGEETEEGMRRQHERCVQQAGLLLATWPVSVAAELEQHLQRCGFEPQLSALQQHTLVLEMVMVCSRKLALSHMQDGWEQQAQQHLAAAVQACSQLVELHPADAGFKLLLGSISSHMRPPGPMAMPELRASFAAADTSTDHWTAATAGLNLVHCLTSGLEGSTWSVAEVQHLLERAEHHDRLCKAWLPVALSNKRQVEHAQAMVGQEVAKRPGATTLPVSFGMPDVANSTHLGNLDSQLCSYCNQHVHQLKRCSACKRVAYCSVECQRQAWKTHKQDCLRWRRGAAEPNA